MKLDSKIPAGPLADKWNNHKAKLRLVNPANRRKYHIIVVGSGLAGSAAAAKRVVAVSHQLPAHR